MVDISFTRNTSGKEIGSGAKGSPGFEEEIFEKYPVAEFIVDGISFAFPVLRISESGGNRIIERERPYRDGAKLDDTGSKARRWTLDTIFNQTLVATDGRINKVNGQLPLYPQVLNKMIDFFDQSHVTVNLVIPTVGTRRVRAETYNRVESMDERDQALVSFTFIEDNEDAVDFKRIDTPDAASNSKRISETTTVDAQSVGSWSEAMSEFEQFAFELEDFANAPGNSIQDVEAATLRVIGSSQRAIRTFSEASRPGRDLFLDPQNSRVVRKLTIAMDMAFREANRVRNNLPVLTTVVFPGATTIFRVAAIVGQDPADLIDANPKIDPLFIPANVFIKVFSTESFLNGASSAP